VALLTKWPVFLQNAFGNPAYVNQNILKLGEKLGDQTGAKQKSAGLWPTQALRIAAVNTPDVML